METMYIFKDYVSGGTGIFTSYEKALEFQKAWLKMGIDEDWGIWEDDYAIIETKVNPTVEDFWN